MMRILVTGATGFVGRSLVPALIDAGHDVKAGTRRPERFQGPEGAVPVLIDVDDPATVSAAIEACDAVYFLVHAMADAGDFAMRERAAAETLAASARQAGARVVYLGGLGGPDSDKVSEHLRSRHEVGRILRDGCDTVELRAGMVIGKGSTSFEILRQLVDRLPAMVCPVWVGTRAQVIALPDVIRYLVAALALPPGPYDVGMDEVLTYEQMMARYARLAGRRRLILKVPFLTPGLSSRWIGLVTDQPASVARPLAEGLAAEVLVADGARIRDLVPFEPMGFDAAVRLALAEPSALHT